MQLVGMLRGFDETSLLSVLISLTQGKRKGLRIISYIITNRCAVRAVTPKKVIMRNRITYNVQVWSFTHGGGFNHTQW